jgi:hypothetical protein
MLYRHLKSSTGPYMDIQDQLGPLNSFFLLEGLMAAHNSSKGKNIHNKPTK